MLKRDGSLTDRGHIGILHVTNNWSKYYNYRDRSSICICWYWLLVFVRWVGVEGRQYDDGGVCYETLGLSQPRELPSGNENCCNVASGTKIPIFSVTNNAFPFSQHCMNPYSKDLNDEETFFNHHPSIKRRATGNGFGICINMTQDICKLKE